jgi:hypothetical protein
MRQAEAPVGGLGIAVATGVPQEPAIEAGGRHLSGQLRPSLPYQRHGSWGSFGAAREARLETSARQFLRLEAGAAALPAVSHNTSAQSYPACPITTPPRVGVWSASVVRLPVLTEKS